MKTKFLLLLVASISLEFLAGCDAAVKDFVKTARPDNTIDNPAPISNGPIQMKVSPGRMVATSSRLSATGNVTATNKFLTSSSVSATVGISRSRVSQQ